MAFFEVPRGTGGLTMSITERKDQNGANVIRFGISESVLRDFGYDVENTHAINVQFGFGKDLGTVLMTPLPEGKKPKDAPSAYALSRISAQSRAVAVSCAKAGINFNSSPALPCIYSENGNSFLVRIPGEIMETHKFNSTGRLREQRADEADLINAQNQST